jgi:hypothetical protein
MAHKTVGAAVEACIKEQGFREVIIVWRKDFERWCSDIIAAIDTTKFDIIDPPLHYTKNQLIVAAKPGTYTPDEIKAWPQPCRVDLNTDR